MSNGALKQAFFSKALASRLVDGPAGQVLVKSLTVGGKDRVQNAAASGFSYRPIVIRECLYDPEAGKPIFGTDDKVDELPADVAEPYIEAALELSALTRAEIEELEGNSVGTSSNGTGST